MPESNAPAPNPRGKRERSTRYPGVSLAESVEFCALMHDRGVDGLSAGDIAQALGYKNIKTNTFSARLSGARQFGLLALKGDGYTLTPLAQAILHPIEPAEVPALYRKALLEPPLYAELFERLAGKKVPEAAILGNILYHHHQIIATAKLAAAEAFLASARFAGALGDDQVLRPIATAAAPRPPEPVEPPVKPLGGTAPTSASSFSPRQIPPRGDVRLDLRLWDADEGKTIRLRVPQSITPESFERFLQAFRLLVRIERE